MATTEITMVTTGITMVTTGLQTEIFMIIYLETKTVGSLKMAMVLWLLAAILHHATVMVA